MRTILPHEKNPLLREKAEDVTVSEIKNKHIQTLIKEMRMLLAKEEHGVALAAPQVGEPLRLFIVSGRALARDARNAPGEKKKIEGVFPPLPDEIYINPDLLKLSREKNNKHEGCLSIRGKWGMVPRAEKATIRAYNEKGECFTRGASGFLAHIFQHEIDHLQGILYIDKAKKIYDEQKEK